MRQRSRRRPGLKVSSSPPSHSLSLAFFFPFAPCSPSLPREQKGKQNKAISPHLGPQREAQQQRERVERREHLAEDVEDPLRPPQPRGGRAPEQRQGDKVAQHAVGVVDGHVAPGRDGPRDPPAREQQLQRRLEGAEGGEEGPRLPVEGRGPGRGDPFQSGGRGPGAEEGRGGVELGDGEPAGVLE